MSYCRWSSDDWKSDVYCYGTDAGWITIVAVRRHKNIDDCPKTPDLLPPGVEFTIELAGEYLASHKRQMEWIEASEYENIDLPYAGESFADSTAADCLRTLLMLRGLGYHIPQFAIDELTQESEEAK